MPSAYVTGIYIYIKVTRILTRNITLRTSRIKHLKNQSKKGERVQSRVSNVIKLKIFLKIV